MRRHKEQDHKRTGLNCFVFKEPNYLTSEDDTPSLSMGPLGKISTRSEEDIFIFIFIFKINYKVTHECITTEEIQSYISVENKKETSLTCRSHLE